VLGTFGAQTGEVPQRLETSVDGVEELLVGGGIGVAGAMNRGGRLISARRSAASFGVR
jgi:hypothetical protein